MSPKPILKRAVSEFVHKTDSYDNQGYPNRTHGVHFPPSPATCTYSAHSAAAYDRSPIVVTPNNCALPERGGRTYTLDESQPRRGISFARDFHPRALAFASSRPPLPPLIPDLSSESEESDGWTAALTPSTTSHANFGIHGLAGPSSKCSSDVYGDMNRYTNCVDALAFLPHPPSPPSQKHESINPFPQSYHRRRGERESKHESSSVADRTAIRGSDTQHCHSAFASLSLSSSPKFPTTPTKRSTRKKQPNSPRTSSYVPLSADFSSLDDGCLGGFWIDGIFSFSPMHCTIFASQTGLDLSFAHVPPFTSPFIYSLLIPLSSSHYNIHYKPVFLLCILHWPHDKIIICIALKKNGNIKMAEHCLHSS